MKPEKDILDRLPPHLNQWTERGLHADYLNIPNRFFPIGKLGPISHQLLEQHLTYSEYWRSLEIPEELVPHLVTSENRGTELDQVAQEVKNMATETTINIEKLKLLLLRHFTIVLGNEGQRIADIRQMLELPVDAH